MFTVDTTTTDTTTLTRSTRVGYALGSLATGAFGTVPGLLLLPYLTDALGIAAGFAGLVVLLPKAWDVVLNPIAGRISDRTRTPWGPRRPFLLAGGSALAVLFALLFAGPFTGASGAVYVTIVFILLASAFAFFQVPYVAMPAEITDDYSERTRLMTWRIAVLALAILASGAVAPAIVDSAGGGLTGYRAMGVAVAGLILVGVLGAFVGTRRAPIGTVSASEPSLVAALRVARRNRPFVALLSCFVVQAVGIGVILAGTQYFADHILGSRSATSVLFACFVGPALLVMPLWSRVGARFGKLPGYVVASVLFAIGALGLVLGSVVPAPVVFVLTGVAGCGYAGQQVFGLAMLPDTISADTALTGRRQAGVFTGLWTAGETLGLALGPGLFGLILQLSGYLSTEEGESVVQPDSARLGILLGFSVLPALIVVVGLVFIRRYDLTERTLAALLERKV